MERIGGQPRVRRLRDLDEPSILLIGGKSNLSCRVWQGVGGLLPSSRLAVSASASPPPGPGRRGVADYGGRPARGAFLIENIRYRQEESGQGRGAVQYAVVADGGDRGAGAVDVYGAGVGVGGPY